MKKLIIFLFAFILFSCKKETTVITTTTPVKVEKRYCYRIPYYFTHENPYYKIIDTTMLQCGKTQKDLDIEIPQQKQMLIDSRKQYFTTVIGDVIIFEESK